LLRDVNKVTLDFNNILKNADYLEVRFKMLLLQKDACGSE
jgi:hypothetical protein